MKSQSIIREEITLTRDELNEVIDDDKLYFIVKNKLSDKTNNLIDNLPNMAKDGYIDGIESIRGVVKVVYWADKD